MLRISGRNKLGISCLDNYYALLGDVTLNFRGITKLILRFFFQCQLWVEELREGITSNEEEHSLGT